VYHAPPAAVQQVVPPHGPPPARKPVPQTDATDSHDHHG
jgi:hypothetical protein